MFISFEGIDGCGKTTQLRLLESWLQQQGHSVCVTREPGGTEIGKQIRAILLNPEHHQLVPQAELLLYLADRIQHLQEVILPAKETGQVILCDRFHDATLAYQGGGRKLNLEGIHSIVTEWIQPYLPDVTFLMKVSPEVALERIRKRESEQQDLKESRIDNESLTFFQSVSDYYEQLAKADPKRFVVIDANQSVAEIQKELQKSFPK